MQHIVMQGKLSQSQSSLHQMPGCQRILSFSGGFLSCSFPIHLNSSACEDCSVQEVALQQQRQLGQAPLSAAEMMLLTGITTQLRATVSVARKDSVVEAQQLLVKVAPSSVCFERSVFC